VKHVDLPEPTRGQHWVFHRGALGDSVLLWPMLRQWRMRGVDVVLVCDGEKGRLATRELGVRAEDAESARFNALWVPGASVDPLPEVVSVVAYLGRAGEGTQAWMANARRMFPNAAIAHRSERPSRLKALRFPLPPRRGSADGPVVMHIGAGAAEKRCPVERWVALADAVKANPVDESSANVKLIAGEVEREKLSEGDRAAFVGAGGEFLGTLDELAASIRSARLFVAADSGPGHLAAQLGVPVLSLFGPGNPEKWAPVGPVVRVIAPPFPRTMEWLEVSVVLQAIREMVTPTPPA
jgi:hypothetical protein